MDDRTNIEFTDYLLGAVAKAERLKYFPHRFKAMLRGDGGFETVRNILRSGEPSEGFKTLWGLGALGLSCEAIVVETKWRRYFDPDLIARSEKLLRDSRYAFIPYDGGAELTDAEPAQREPDGTAPHSETGSPASKSLADRPAPSPSIGINAFFASVLNAPASNPRWSWGAVDERTRRVFFRLWRMDLGTTDGRPSISVLGRGGSGSPGWQERMRHVDLVKYGYAAYAVLCDKDRPESGTIVGFDQTELTQLGQVLEEGDQVFIEVLGTVPIASALGFGAVGGVIEDLQALAEATVGETTRTALVAARLGQGRFRRELLRRWDGACAVTGCRVGAVLRASHCKPWRDSDNAERLDSHNGLILAANLDALFDAGLITFDDDGEMLVANVISNEERKALGLPAKLARAPGPKLRGYLRHHRDQVFLK